MGPFGSLQGHYSLKTASEVKSDLRFEISDPNYLLIHVHIAYMVWAILAASEATTASEAKSDLGDLNYICNQSLKVHLCSKNMTLLEEMTITAPWPA